MSSTAAILTAGSLPHPDDELLLVGAHGSAQG